MGIKIILTVGFLSMLAATGVVITTDSFAAHPGRVDVIGTLHDKVTQRDSGRTTAAPLPRVDVIDSITHGGPSYPYMKPMNRLGSASHLAEEWTLLSSMFRTADPL